jgi:hypothetical protein
MSDDLELTKSLGQKIDTISNDYGHERTHREELSEEEKDLVRKLDRRILPIACLLYLFACSLRSLFRSIQGN